MKILRLLLIPVLVLGIFYTGCSKEEKSGTDVKSKPHAAEFWTCSMHPEVKKDGPGTCPICGMDLIKKTVAVSEETPVDGTDMTNTVALSGKKQVLANVSTVKVMQEVLKKELQVYSYLEFTEQSRKVISARFNGRIEKLLVDKTGDDIKAGQPLFEIYSPDLLQAQNDYVLALSNNKNNENSSLLTAAQNRLEVFGMTSAQLEELKNSRKIKTIITYYSPVSGTVIEKKVREGMYVTEGTSLFEIAGMAVLWNISEVSEKDLAMIKVGSSVKLYLHAYPNEEFTGNVSFIYPVVNAQSRTVKVRSVFANQRGKLKPQMYGETVFATVAGKGLLAPADAIIFSGKKTVVWVKMADGMFEGREVLLGGKYGDKYQILTGVQENEEIAASGGFLIDSENQLKTGMPTGHQHSAESAPKSETQSKSASEQKNH